jgi:hypothetical protein
MKIIVRNGVVKQFSDRGDAAEQLANISALIDAVQRYARDMHAVAAQALNADPAFLESYKRLRRDLRCAQNTIAIADKQLKERMAENV